MSRAAGPEVGITDPGLSALGGSRYEGEQGSSSGTTRGIAAGVWQRLNASAAGRFGSKRQFHHHEKEIQEKGQGGRFIAIHRQFRRLHQEHQVQIQKEEL
jgi:hypothetical protein